MTTTKQQLREGALLALREHGIAGVSARTIAAASGVNQALVFYHYGNVVDLLGAACEEATRSRLAAWSDDLAAVRSLRELLALGRRLHAKERDLGHVSALAQLLAGAQTDPKLAESTARSLALWTAEVETVLARVLAGSPIAGVADIGGLGRAVAAAFVGIELYEGVDPAGADRALAALDQFAVLIEAVDELGPVARRAVKAKATRAVAKAAKAR